MGKRRADLEHDPRWPVGAVLDGLTFGYGVLSVPEHLRPRRPPKHIPLPGLGFSPQSRS